ncbi:Replication termination factor 2 [Cladobotryum mycophilum]|uniref:Replication termination factor 2 n=1 Tax=Cladobotryum mycophilum TaxID=491253 RepID=A0ABR0STB0_9HYPO
MGNDGGSIPKRRELVKNAARAPTVSELKATALESLAHAWTHCALSGMPIDLDSVVSDWRGRLYNYEAILKGLMPSDEAPEVTPASLGIRSLRDVAKLQFSKSGDKWACPISMKEIGPSTKAVYLIPCGHVFAEVAITEIKENACPECGEALTQDNVVPILPTVQKELEKLEKRMEDLRAKGLTHTLKKDKSEKKKKRKGARCEKRMMQIRKRRPRAIPLGRRKKTPE